MENNPQNLPRFIPPKEMFEADKKEVVPVHGIAKGQLNTPTYNVELPPEGGVLSWHVGDKFPVKSWPFREAIYAIDCIKRVIINGARFFTKLPINILRGRVIRSAMEFFVDYCDTVFDRWGRMLPMQDDNGMEFGLQGVCWKPQFYCDMVREFRRVALQIAGDDEVNKKFVNAICMIFEFDDAYRYRIQDGFGIIDREAFLKNPGKEARRVFKIMQERGEGTSEKFGTFVKIIPFIFKVKIVRNTLKKFIELVDIEKMVLDEVDFYRCLLWGGYRYMGMSDVERASLRIMIDEEWQYREKQEQKKVDIKIK